MQELIAPLTVKFLGQDWSAISFKAPLAVLAQLPPKERDRNNMFLLHIAKITSIAENVIRYVHSLEDLGQVLIAQKVAWAARRQTAREEDLCWISRIQLSNSNHKESYKGTQLGQIKYIVNYTEQTIEGI